MIVPGRAVDANGRGTHAAGPLDTAGAPYY